MARSKGRNEEASLREAGFERLFKALEELVTPALAYKRRKPAEVLLHHLQEHVQTPLEQRLFVELATLQNTLHAERVRMHACPSNVGKAVWRSVMPLLPGWIDARSEEHTSELQSLMRISYAVFCLKKKKISRANTY